MYISFTNQREMKYKSIQLEAKPLTKKLIMHEGGFYKWDMKFLDFSQHQCLNIYKNKPNKYKE